jgi:hypothetical protein
MTTGPLDLARPLEPARAGRVIVLRPATALALALFAGGGWAWAAWERFIEVPSAVAGQRITTALEMVDKFSDSDAQRAYLTLSEELKPWWEQIQEQQRKIMAADQDAEREALIARRDELLLDFIRKHDLGTQIELLIDSFDQFDRCLATEACDEDILRKAISIDVKRIYRTFKPFIQSRREAPKAEDRDRDFGKGLESLFFRFLS